MSKLDDLIKELCPNGVKYRKLGEIAIVSRGASPRPIKNFITSDKNGVNWIKIGDVLPNSKYITNTQEKITQEGAKKSRYVKSGDFILSNSMSFGRPYILNINGCIHDGWLSISEFEKYALSDYLYYILTSNQIQKEMKQKASFGGAVQNLNADIVREIKIPVPPLEVQREIVRILDNFTELTQELTQELTLRKKQYEYYRDMLLNFENVCGGTAECEWRTLGEVIVSLNTGLNPRKFFQLNTDNAQNYYITIKEIRNGKIIPTDKTDRINDEALHLCNNRSNLEVGDILFSGTGTIGEMAVITQKPTNWNIKEGVYAIKPIKSVILSFFLYYVLQTEYIKSEYMKKIAGGTVKSIPMSEMKKIKIPVPPIRVQERIVNVLDNFDTICNDLNIGLPKEIELRKKQYEFYRDCLLTYAATGAIITKSRAEQSRAEQSRAEQSRAEQSRAEQSRAEQSRAGIIRLIQYVFGSVKIRLSELFITKNGYTPSKANSEFWNESAAIPWFKMEDIRENGRILSDSTQHITEKAIKGNLFPANSIIMSTSATIGEHALITVSSLANQRFTYLTIKSEYTEFVNIKFLYYYCFKLGKFCKEHLNKGNFASVDMKSFNDFEFVIPPIEKQERIVKILDRFDSLCNDLTSGLPAEISARQKQYEYYRDKLFTF